MCKKSFLFIIAILALLQESVFCAETAVPSKAKTLRQALDECEKNTQLAKKTDAPASAQEEKETPQAAPASTEEKSSAEKKNFWERVNIHGYYQNRNYFDRKKDNAQEHAYELRQDLRLESSQRISERFSSFLSLDGQYDIVHNSAQGTNDVEKRFKLWECYLNYAASNLNVRLGRQVIRWGKSDEINPTDNFTPEDWTEYLNLARAERKLPVWMTKLDYAFEPFNIEIIWLPFFEASRIPETGSDWEPYLLRQYNASGIPVGTPERPAQNLSNQVAALKVSKTTQDYDLSLSYAYHYDELPALHRDLVSIGPPPLFFPNYEVSQRYHRQHTIGSDFETLIGKVGVRGEFAYTLGDRFVSDSPLRADGTVKKNTFTGIVGGDYTFKNRIYVNLQYYAQYIPDHEEGMTSRRYEDSLIYKISRKFLHDTLLLEATGRLHLFNLDRYWEVKCEYALTDALTVAVGYDNFFGPSDGTFGQYNKNDQFFAKAKYSF